MKSLKEIGCCVPIRLKTKKNYATHFSPLQRRQRKRNTADTEQYTHATSARHIIQATRITQLLPSSFHSQNESVWCLVGAVQCIHCAHLTNVDAYRNYSAVPASLLTCAVWMDSPTSAAWWCHQYFQRIQCALSCTETVGERPTMQQLLTTSQTTKNPTTFLSGSRDSLRIGSHVTSCLRVEYCKDSN